MGKIFDPPAGAILARAYAEDTTTRSLVATTIPADDTVPQNTEGTEILSVSITPKRSNSRIRIRAACNFIIGGTGTMCIALFKDADASALAAAFRAMASNITGDINLVYEFAHGSSVAMTFSIRAGRGSSTWYSNVDGAGAAVGGGSMRNTLIVEEVA